MGVYSIIPLPIPNLHSLLSFQSLLPSLFLSYVYLYHFASFSLADLAFFQFLAFIAILALVVLLPSYMLCVCPLMSSYSDVGSILDLLAALFHFSLFYWVDFGAVCYDIMEKTPWYSLFVLKIIKKIIASYLVALSMADWICSGSWNVLKQLFP